MPTYDYGCYKCGHSEEQVHGMVERPAFTCPGCGEPLTKLMTTAGFKISGGGTSVNSRMNDVMTKKNNAMSGKQRDHFDTGPKVKPNIAGYETGTWTDAHKLAKEANLSPDTYKEQAAKAGEKTKLVVPTS